MAIEFNDGSHKLYKNYTNSRSWNNSGLLQLNPYNGWDKWLMDNYNSVEAMKNLLAGEAIGNTRLNNKGSKLSELFACKHSSIIVVKGLHQWQIINGTNRYFLHITVGLDARLWHFYALYSNNSVRLTGGVSAGEQVGNVTHDGWTIVN